MWGDYLKPINDKIVDFIEKAQPKLDKKQEETPEWLFITDTGNEKVIPQKLAYVILREVPILRVSSFPQGARFDNVTGTWRMDNLSEFLDGYITDKLESVGKWSQRTLSEVKRFITIKAYDRNSKTNPFDTSKPYLISFMNGTYNLRTNELHPHDPMDYILQSHDYELVIDETKQAVKTKEWLFDLTKDSESVLYLMELVGYCFYRSYSSFQTITILKGAGGNGKSVFLNHLIKMLNDNNVSNASLRDLGNKNNRFVTSMLYQKLANIFADIENDFIESTGILKALTGSDKIYAEQKGLEPFMFTNFSKLIFSANDLPNFSDMSIGFDRRLYVVPFVTTIEEGFKKKHDLKAIEQELSVFAYECLTSFKKAVERGDLTVSASMKEAKDQWLKDSNHISRFIEEHCYIDEQSQVGDPTRLIFEKYKNFCFEENLRGLSQPKFNRQLEKYNISKSTIRHNGTRMPRYIHLFLKSDYD